MGFRFIIASLTLAFVGGCSSFSKDLAAVQPGWDRSRVVESLGSPNQNFRRKSVDHWIYEYYDKNLKKRSMIRFKAGKVIDIREVAIDQTFNKSEFEEYKEGLRKKRTEREAFQNLDE